MLSIYELIAIWFNVCCINMVDGAVEYNDKKSNDWSLN